MQRFPLRLVIVGAAVVCESFPIIRRSFTSSSTSMAMTTKSSTTTSSSSGSSSTSSSTIKPIYNVYPLSQLTELKQRFTNVKKIHIIRHAEGTHNVNREYNDERHLDARLTEKGFQQCRNLFETDPDVHNTELIVTSTLTRCIQTALHSFPHLLNNNHNQKIPLVAHESIRETVNYACDRRRPISDIQMEFPMVDFSHVDDHLEDDEIWNHYTDRLGLDWTSRRESAELHKVAERGRTFWTWLSVRPESEVIVCTHSAFLRCIMSWGHDGGVQYMMPQDLVNDNNPAAAVVEPPVPVKRYRGDSIAFEQSLRKDFKNCELRSFVMVFDEH